MGNSSEPGYLIHQDEANKYKTSGPDPHDGNSQDQCIEAVEPPKYLLMASQENGKRKIYADHEAS